jgi:hypothetical protein|nr:MAG TPA: hypothetical protein [Caudoviricetes sp.]
MFNYGAQILMIEPVHVSRLQVGDRLADRDQYLGRNRVSTITAITPADDDECPTLHWEAADGARGSILTAEGGCVYRIVPTVGDRYDTIAAIQDALVDPTDDAPGPDQLIPTSVLIDRDGDPWTADAIVANHNDAETYESLYGPWTVVWPGGGLW